MTTPQVTALKKLIGTAQLLQQNSEGCAVIHHGLDFEQQGLPGWLIDTQKSIDEAAAALAHPAPEAKVREAVTSEMVTAAMRAFELMSSVLRYREKDKWHACDIMGMRDALVAALSLPHGAGEADGRVPDREIFWLVERVGHQQYVKDRSQLPGLTDDPWRAARFATERAAHDFWLRLATLRDECKPVEHLFVNKDAPSPALGPALKTAIGHIDHMAAWITKQNAGYSFESLGEDMPGIRAALAQPAPEAKVREAATYCGNCQKEVTMERAILSIDGDCGCALLGENLQEGEAEFVKIEQRSNELRYKAEVRACWAAFKKLKERLGKDLTYAWQTRRPGSSGA